MMISAKVVSVTKTFRGHEFAIASLESIYPFMYKMIFIHSNKSWIGESGDNTVEPLILEWKKKNDALDKIINIPDDTGDQAKQYLLAWDACGGIPHDYKMMIDTDEVWDITQIQNAFAYLSADVKTLSFASAIYTHVKSPLYQTVEYDKCQPVAFVRGNVPYSGIRCHLAGTRRLMPGVHFHHLCYVRKSLSDVITKLRRSNEIEREKTVDLSLWVRQKWNRLPGSEGLLPIVGHEKNLGKFKAIKREELPESMQNHPLVIAWEGYAQEVSPCGPR
jgi:hypothetical protein